MTIDAQAILNGRILVVDDQPANVALLEQALREQGYANVDLDHGSARGLRPAPPSTTTT